MNRGHPGDERRARATATRSATANRRATTANDHVASASRTRGRCLARGRVERVRRTRMARRRERLLGTASPRVDVDVGTRARTTDGTERRRAR